MSVYYLSLADVCVIHFNVHASEVKSLYVVIHNEFIKYLIVYSTIPVSFEYCDVAQQDIYYMTEEMNVSLLLCVV